jgi:hypothetical protein
MQTRSVRSLLDNPKEQTRRNPYHPKLGMEN